MALIRGLLLLCWSYDWLIPLLVLRLTYFFAGLKTGLLLCWSYDWLLCLRCLCALGGFIHSMADSLDIRFMVGLSVYMPFTSSCLMVSSFALCGNSFAVLPVACSDAADGMKLGVVRPCIYTTGHGTNLFCDWLADSTRCAPIPWPVGGVGWTTLLHAVAVSGEAAAACISRSPSWCCCGKRRRCCGVCTAFSLPGAVAGNGEIDACG